MFANAINGVEILRIVAKSRMRISKNAQNAVEKMRTEQKKWIVVVKI